MNKVQQMLEALEKEFRNKKQYSAADKLLPIIEEAEKDGWIPCSEGLPEKDVNVLVCDDSDNLFVYSLTYYGDEYMWEDDYGYWIPSEVVTAWMPLPEPYKGE